MTKYCISGAASARGPNHRDGSSDEKSHRGGREARLQRAGAHHPARGEDRAAEAQTLKGVNILPGVLCSYCPSHSLLLCHPGLAGAGEAPLQLNLKEGMLKAHPREQEGQKPHMLPWRRWHSTDFKTVFYSLCIVWGRGEVLTVNPDFFLESY